MSDRLSRLQRLLREHDADAALLTGTADIRWVTGFTGSNALVVIRRDECHFLTDGRYGSQAADEVAAASIHVPGYDLIGEVAAQAMIIPGDTVVVSDDTLSAAEFAEMQERLPGCTWLRKSGLLSELRGGKDEEEIQSIRRAQAVTEEVVEEVLPRLVEGVAESEIAAELVYHHLLRGASGMAFEPIVAFGERSALPHARASHRTLAKGDVILIDVGCYIAGYASDMTRMFVLGQPSEEVRTVYDAVLEAQKIGVDNVVAGASGKQIDSAARQLLGRHGLAEHFTHGLGHGVGLDVHEWPRLSQAVDHTLPENAVVTVEPGVYLPGRFGVRIEDLVIARTGEPEVITSTSKVLRVL